MLWATRSTRGWQVCSSTDSTSWHNRSALSTLQPQAGSSASKKNRYSSGQPPATIRPAMVSKLAGSPLMPWTNTTGRIRVHSGRTASHSPARHSNSVTQGSGSSPWQRVPSGSGPYWHPSGDQPTAWLHGSVGTHTSSRWRHSLPPGGSPNPGLQVPTGTQAPSPPSWKPGAHTQRPSRHSVLGAWQVGSQPASSVGRYSSPASAGSPSVVWSPASVDPSPPDVEPEQPAMERPTTITTTTKKNDGRCISFHSLHPRSRAPSR